MEILVEMSSINVVELLRDLQNFLLTDSSSGLQSQDCLVALITGRVISLTSTSQNSQY